MSDNAVGLYIVFWAQPGKIDALVEAVSAMIATASAEEGTLVYGIHRIRGERQGVSVYEIYSNTQAQNVHRESPALATLRAQLGDLIAAPPEAHDLEPIPNGKGLPF